MYSVGCESLPQPRYPRMPTFCASSGNTSSGETFWLMPAMRRNDRNGPGTTAVDCARAGAAGCCSAGEAAPATGALQANGDEQIRRVAARQRGTLMERHPLPGPDPVLWIYGLDWFCAWWQTARLASPVPTTLWTRPNTGGALVMRRAAKVNSRKCLRTRAMRKIPLGPKRLPVSC